jgi:hypothetical protein
LPIFSPENLSFFLAVAKRTKASGEYAVPAFLAMIPEVYGLIAICEYFTAVEKTIRECRLR